MSRYKHRQVGRIHTILGLLVAVLLVVLGFLAVSGLESGSRAIGFVVVSGVCVLLTLAMLSFRHLDIEVTESELSASFGPLPIFRRRIELRRIREARPGRVRLIDGLGIHWHPGRGWIWNVAGGGLVDLTLDGGRFRLGTDDQARLLAALGGPGSPNESPGVDPTASRS